MKTFLDKIIEFVTDATKYPVDHNMESMDTSLFMDSSLQTLKWLLIAFVAFFIIVLIFERVKWVRRLISFLLDKYLGLMMGAVWIMGFVTYCVGSHIDVGNHFFDVVPMAMIRSTEMFLSISDISAIKPDCLNSAVFMTAFNTSHFLAILLSLAFVIRQFGYHAMAKIRLWVISICSCFKKFQYDKIFLFWGVNDASYILAKDIINRIDKADTNDKPNRRGSTGLTP